MICCTLLKKLQKADYNQYNHCHYIVTPLVIMGGEILCSLLKAGI